MTPSIASAAARRHSALALVLTACVGLSGCAFAPGMKMNTSSPGWLADTPDDHAPALAAGDSRAAEARAAAASNTAATPVRARPAGVESVATPPIVDIDSSLIARQRAARDAAAAS
ncbi:sugar ABC transporter substrate-binding protein, partial [Burkholderia cenocepacia]